MKPINRPLTIFLLAVLAGCCFNGYGQQTDSAKTVVGRLTAFLKNKPAEKAYLQFDKPYYAAGDTIYFKAYVTKGEQHKLSDLSGILHVDLVNTKNKIDRSIKLQLDSGLAWGDFALPDSLPAGNYRVRAYTQWMRNNDERDFFDREIPVGSPKAARIPESAQKQPGIKPKPDVQFMPEGGGLVAGIDCKVGFKAIGPNGLGIDVTGSVVDNDNKAVATFASSHLGMGCFSFVPVEGKTYTAKINYLNGQQDNIPLPKPETAGIALTVNNDPLPEATVTLTANKAWYSQNKGKPYTLLIYSGGLITTVNCKLDSPVIKLDILKRKLHTGIATVTLFGQDNEPLCERLFFVQNYDQLALNIRSDQSNYSPRGKVNIKLHAINRKGDPVDGHFSVSVIDESKVAGTDGNNDNILTNLLLTSDLKGYVEEPNYYFDDTSSATPKNLDILMLTQGYRRFEWKRVLDSAGKSAKYRPETGMTIAGRVNNMLNKPLVKSTVTLIPLKDGPIISSKTDDKGLFRFSNLVFADTTHFVLSAVKVNGKNSTKITWFDDRKNIPAVTRFLSPVKQLVQDSAMANYVVTDQTEQKEVVTYLKGKGVMLKEVKIKAHKPLNDYYTQSLAGAGGADQVIYPKDVLYGGPLTVRLAGLIHGAHPGPGLAPVNNITQGTMAVIVDGFPGDLGDVATDGFATIEILQPPTSYIYGQDGRNGVIVITTKPRGSDPADIVAMGVLPILVDGFYKARTFYSPKYDTPAALPGKESDLRSTIYWNPEIKADKEGNAGFDFYNADGAGTYKVTVEGMDKDGNIGRQVYRYDVK